MRGLPPCPLKPAHWMICRQSAKTIAFDQQRTVHPRAHVLERDGRAELYDLAIVEMALDFDEHRVRDIDRGLAHFLSEKQRRSFSGASASAPSPLCNLARLF